VEIVRWFVIVVLLALAAFAGLLAYISLSHIGEAHQDNSTANYLWLGVPAVAVLRRLGCRCRVALARP
jgi:uncharacterized membrane protein